MATQIVRKQNNIDKLEDVALNLFENGDIITLKNGDVFIKSETGFQKANNDEIVEYAKIANKAYTADKADTANSSEKINHSLTISLNGNDYVFDGSSDIHISIPTTASQPVTPSETPSSETPNPS